MKFSRGAIYMIFAALFFSIMAALVKLGGNRLPSQEMVLFRSIVVLILNIYLIKRTGLPLWGYNKKLLWLRGFTGFWGLSAFYYTLTQIPISDSVAIQYTSPLWTALIATFVLKERNPLIMWIFFILAFSGVMFIVRPGFSFYTTAALLGLAGAVCSGTAYTLVRKLRTTDHPLNIILYLPIVSIILSLPIVVNDFIIPVGWEWLTLFLMGLSTFIAQIFLTKSLHEETAAKATNISYVSILFSTMFGLMFWGEIPDWRTGMGALLVIVAILKIARK
jgi:drug/metabolite transporter (DMT)-like permease